MKLHKLPNGNWISPLGVTGIYLREDRQLPPSREGPYVPCWAITITGESGIVLAKFTSETSEEALKYVDEIAAIVNAAHEHSGDRLLPGIAAPLLPALFSANYSTGEVSRVPPHQQRVYEEKGELDAKLRGLTSFIESHPVFPTLPEDEQDRMIRQRAIMTAYSALLSGRIAAF